MDPVPDVNDVVAVAQTLGIHRGPEEAVRSRTDLLEPRRAFDTCLQARVSSPICGAGNHLRHTTRHRRA
jgi:hypothetical protein